MAEHSPLHAAHDAAGARMTEFGGWSMPVQFDSIQTEHRAVRATAGRFDVSHMGQVEVAGTDATRLMQRLTTNDVTELDVGEALYAGVTDEEGVLLEDVVLYALEGDEPRYLFVPNAGNDEAMVERWIAHRDRWGLEATVTTRTDEFGMIALQGPAARSMAARVAGREIWDIGRFEIVVLEIANVSCLVSRTGYTGEDGLEVLVPWAETQTVWETFSDATPCGLGARDTLRLEAGFLLSGQDFHPTEQPRSPYEAGIGFAVKLDTEFVGRDALERQDAEGVEERRVGLRLIDQGVPRAGYPIETTAGEHVGTVTSGTMSPSLGVPIGMGYVPTALAKPGTTLRVVIRDEPKKARVETMPFVDTAQ